MRLPKRRFYSLVPMALSMLFLISIDPRTVVLLPLALAGVQWYLLGTAYIFAVAVYLLYAWVGGLYGLTTFALAFMAVAMGKLDRERAPHGEYVVLVASILLSIPTYILLSSLSSIVSGVEVTVLAVLFLATLYFFVKAVAGD